MYPCRLCSLEFSTIRELLKHNLNHKVGTPQEEALDLSTSKSHELLINEEKNLPTSSATLTPSHHSILPGSSLGAVKDHANHPQDGNVGKQLTRSEESESGMGDSGENCFRRISHKKTSDHQISTEVQTTPYQCQICMKSFRQPKTLQNHIRTHTGERPYHCQLCSQPFARQGDLKKHNLTHADDRLYRYRV